MRDNRDADTAGLCGTCLHCRRVVSDRGAVFYRCGLHDTDLRFPKYPNLPVRSCAGYERSPSAAVSSS